MNQAVFLLNQQETNRHYVANEQAANDDKSSKMQKDIADFRVGSSHSFEHTNGLCTFEYENKQTTHHREARNAEHQYKNYHHIKV